MIDCPKVDVPAAEEERIVLAALDSRPFELQDHAFESHSVSKCITKYQTDGEPPQDAHSEYLSFYGVFPHIVRSHDYRERYAIRCSVSSDWISDEKTNEHDYCNTTLERFLKHKELNDEVILRGNLARDVAEAYLEHLMSHTSLVRGEGILIKDYRKIRWIEVRRAGKHFKISASWSNAGCATTTYESTVVKEPELRFSDFDGSMTIC